MKRVLVTGNAGSGKSTVAKYISKSLKLPLHGLDCVIWQPGWKKRPPDDRSTLIREIVEQETWVIDGVSFDVQSHAEAIVFLDIPRRISYFRVMKRNWRYLFRSRPGLPARCPEILMILPLCRIIWNFPKNIRPQILSQSSEHPRFFHIRNSTDLAACLKALHS